LGKIIGEEIAGDWCGGTKEIRKRTAVCNVRLYKLKMMKHLICYIISVFGVAICWVTLNVYGTVLK